MSSEKRFMDFVKKDKQRVGVTDEDAREKVSFRQIDPNGTSCYFLLWDYYRVWHSQSNMCLSDECVLSCCLQWKKVLYCTYCTCTVREIVTYLPTAQRDQRVFPNRIQD